VIFDSVCCKAFSLKKSMTLFKEEIPANIRASSSGNTEGMSVIQID
jgi:hypothetical protein